MHLMTDIHVRCFSGSSIRAYIHSIAKLRCDILKDYPYFDEPDLNFETAYLKHICSCKEAISVLIFDNTTLVGAALGYPFSMEHPDLHAAFEEKKLKPSSYYFFGESTLLKPYRGRGIGHHFFDARESYLSSLKTYQQICFCAPASLESLKERPTDFIPLHDFWRKRGYIHHPEIQVRMMREKVDETHPKETLLTFWIKKLENNKKR